MAYVWIALGVALLYWGGDVLVGSSARLARRFGMSPLLVGLTVVAFGTSAPELAASLSAALRGSGGIAIGNVVGSNVANIGLILAACAAVTPIRAELRTVRREGLLLPATALLLLALLWDAALGRVEGALLLLGLAGYLVLTVRAGRAEPEDALGDVTETVDAVGSAPRGGVGLAVAGIAAGLALLVGGATALVEGATTLARAVGLSERVIGLTVVAVGTSLPELATSLVAALRGQADIALGNVIGSNVFNALGILGLTAAAVPLGLPSDALGALRVDLVVMTLASVVLLPMLVTGARLARWEGAALLTGWIAYLVYLIL